MSEVFTAIFKKIVVVLIVVTALLPLITTFLNFGVTIFSTVPVFARYYTSLGLAVFVFKIVKDWISD